MKRIYFILVIAILAVIAIFYFANRNATPPATIDKSKVQVTASFFPLYFFAQAIGGDMAQVYNLTPAGVEPHEYEPTPRDMARITNGDLLILNGGGLEPWASDIQNILGGSNVNVLFLNTDIPDPHVWLAPLLAKKEAGQILQEFIKIDPANTEYYKTNIAALDAKFDMLDQAFRSGLANCAQNKIVTSHAAFGHLATAYDLEQMPIAGLSPDAEPSSQDLTRVAKFARENNIKYIFFESLVSPKLSETIAREVGAQTLVLDPIESGTDYFAQMYNNLSNLQIALECIK